MAAALPCLQVRTPPCAIPSGLLDDDWEPEPATAVRKPRPDPGPEEALGHAWRGSWDASLSGLKGVEEALGPWWHLALKTALPEGHDPGPDPNPPTPREPPLPFRPEAGPGTDRPLNPVPTLIPSTHLIPLPLPRAYLPDGACCAS